MSISEFKKLAYARKAVSLLCGKFLIMGEDKYFKSQGQDAKFARLDQARVWAGAPRRAEAVWGG
jgi:hypothetical protein